MNYLKSFLNNGILTFYGANVIGIILASRPNKQLVGGNYFD